MKILGPPTPKLNFSKNVRVNINRMDPMQPYTVEPMLIDNSMNQVQHFPKDFFPMMTKKYSQPPSHIYKHVYVTGPNKYVSMEVTKKKKRKKDKEESWLDMLHPFGDDSEEEEENEDEED